MDKLVMDVKIITVLSIEKKEIRKETDIHSNCDDGNAHFNYRHIFKLTG
jgi:hypothetical protein